MQQLIDAHRRRAVREPVARGRLRSRAGDPRWSRRTTAALPQPRTMVTDRPVTIVTRSLIELTPARRSSAKMPQPAPRHTPLPSSIEAAAQPLDALDALASLAPEVPPVPPQLSELPAAAPPRWRADAARSGSPPRVLPGQDLASVHGGTRITATNHLPGHRRSGRCPARTSGRSSCSRSPRCSAWSPQSRIQLGPSVRSTEPRPVVVAQRAPGTMTVVRRGRAADAGSPRADDRRARATAGRHQRACAGGRHRAHRGQRAHRAHRARCTR